MWSPTMSHFCFRSTRNVDSTSVSELTWQAEDQWSQVLDLLNSLHTYLKQFFWLVFNWFTNCFFLTASTVSTALVCTPLKRIWTESWAALLACSMFCAASCAGVVTLLVHGTRFITGLEFAATGGLSYRTVNWRLSIWSADYRRILEHMYWSLEAADSLWGCLMFCVDCTALRIC